MRPLSSNTWGEAEIHAINEVVASGQFTMGKRVAEFEEAYARYVGTEYCVACNSGSSANLLMVAAHTLKHGPGRVIVPAVGWATSYSPFHQYGWTLLFVDVDPHTLTFDLDQVYRAKQRYGADAILAVNLLGNPNKFDEFPDLLILEDNCESMGAKYRGKRAGSFGVMGTHSTFFSHHICTMEGGMVTTDDREMYEMMLAIRSHGWTRHLPEHNVLGARVDKFNFILPGYNVRPTEMQAALGLAQLRKLDGFVKTRRENAKTCPYKTQREVGESSWFGFVVYDDEREEAARKHESRPVVSGNFTRQPVIRHYKYEVLGDLPGANYLHDQIMIGNSHEPIQW